MRDLERYARNLRNENRATITTHKNAPKKNEGVNGDIRITTTTTEGVKLFSKYNGEWYSTPLSKHIIKEKNQDRRTLASMSSLETSGYQKLDSGFIIQWGITSDSDATPTITFPIAFPNECFQVLASSGGSGGTSNIDTYAITTTNFIMRHGAGERPSYWQAIGY